jgi:succinyl-diaminopimelate desuccinylase
MMDVMADDPKRDSVLETVDAMRRAMVMALVDMCSIPAVCPQSGGEGELRKLEWLQEHIRNFGFDEFVRYDAVDEDKPSVVRPNLVAVRHGEHRDGPTLWFVAHVDVVPEGDRSLWESDPWRPVVREDKVVGRGVEDNGTPLIASIYAVKALSDVGVRQGLNVGCALVADEEMGSKYGIQHLIEKGVFHKGDIIVVPDAGVPKGDSVEIAEKSILWLKFKVEGKQGHASMPQTAKNALEAGVELAYRVNKELKSTMTERDELFDPPYSTFELTMKVANVANINTIPGEDIFFMDCRVLPERSTDEVLDTVRKVMKQVGDKYGTTIHLSLVQNERAAPRTDPESRVVQLLMEQVRLVLNVEPRVYGIGGGTCAAYFRKVGFDAAVWAKIDEVAHSANEYTWIQNIVDMTKVFALMMLRA